MPDSKITALTALTAADPANDMIPIVDVSDTPPASGNTKRISINNILAASGTATLASATISGALTVDTTTLVVNPAGYPDRVGIGTATPDESLTVAGNIKLNGNRTVIFQTAAGVAAGTVSFKNSSGVQKGAIGSYVNVADEGAVEIIGPTGVSNAVFRSSGNLDLNTGNLVMGVSGKGIDFSATASGSGTMTSELLNDYEEGTFTPLVTFGGASVGMVISSSGRYTKVGRAVTVSGLITITARGTSTGNALITGLPFTSAAGDYVAASLRLASISFTDAFQGYVSQSSTTITLEQITNAGTESPLTHSNFSVGSSFLIWNCTYTV